MKIKLRFSIILMLVHLGCESQVSRGSGIFLAKEYSKEISLYKAKEFVMEDILGNRDKVLKFEIKSLAAASSGELTSLVYRCEDLQKEGLVLGFYGDRWNESGVVYQSYAFKNFPKQKAIEMLKIIDSVTSVYEKFMSSEKDVNNIYFHFEDITFLAYFSPLKLMLRVFWNGYDSEWEWSAIAKTQKRLLKKLQD